MEEKPNPSQKQIQIKADEAVQVGVYANVARISHDAEAFVLDFVVIHGSPPFGRLLSRVVLTPGNAKRLSQALTQNIEAFEQSHGAIRMPAPPHADPGIVQ